MSNIIERSSGDDELKGESTKVLTTGMMDFMINSGLMTDMAAIPVPDLAVPYAAPRAEKTMAEVAPITPKNGPYTGFSAS